MAAPRYTAAMTTTQDPRKLDMARLASQGQVLEGRWPLAVLPRLAEMHLPSQPAAEVHWRAQGELRPVLGGEAEIWLHLQAEGAVAMSCQRCLAPVTVPLEVDRWIRFVRGEHQAAELDADSEDDVLALPRWLDLAELVEDELLLVLPIVPRHEVCPTSLPQAVGEEVMEEGRANPFAVLAGMKRPSSR